MIAYLLSALAVLGLSATPEKKDSGKQSSAPSQASSSGKKADSAAKKKSEARKDDASPRETDEADEKEQAKPAPKPKPPGIRPGSIKPEELKEYGTLSPGRKRLVEEALKLSSGDKWLKYAYGSSDPSSGGLDCSGSMYYIMQQTDIDPPRTSADMFRWVTEAGKLTDVPAAISSLDDTAFSKLQPGDLLFWSGTTGGDDSTVSHVQMFLGHEKSDGLPVMAGASDGRSYRGQRRDGYGVFDFKLPGAGTKARFLGYGPPATLPRSETVAVSPPSPPATPDHTIVPVKPPSAETKPAVQKSPPAKRSSEKATPPATKKKQKKSSKAS